MCIIKTPKIAPTDPTAKTPDPAIIRNPYLDGLDPKAKALRTGRSSLRIERGGGRGSTPPPVTQSSPGSGPTAAPAAPVQGSLGSRIIAAMPNALRIKRPSLGSRIKSRLEATQRTAVG